MYWLWTPPFRERPGPKKKWSANCRLKILKTPIIASRRGCVSLKSGKRHFQWRHFFLFGLCRPRSANPRRKASCSCQGLTHRTITAGKLFWSSDDRNLPTAPKTTCPRFNPHNPEISVLHGLKPIKICLAKNIQQQNYKRFFRTQKQCAINKIYLCTVNIFKITCAFSSTPFDFVV